MHLEREAAGKARRKGSGTRPIPVVQRQRAFFVFMKPRRAKDGSATPRPVGDHRAGRAARRRRRGTAESLDSEFNSAGRRSARRASTSPAAASSRKVCRPSSIDCGITSSPIDDQMEVGTGVVEWPSAAARSNSRARSAAATFTSPPPAAAGNSRTRPAHRPGKARRTRRAL